MRRPKQNKKYKYGTDSFDIKENIQELEDRLNNRYSDIGYDVLSASVFKNGTKYTGLIVWRKLVEENL